MANQGRVFPKGVFGWNYRKLESIIIKTFDIKWVVMVEDSGL